jgi:hypothetical protein
MAKKTQTPKASNGRLSRKDAANRVVVEFTGKSTLSELTAAADALVVAADGRSDLRATGWFVRRCLESAAVFGLVSLTKPVDVIVEKAVRS